MDSEQDSQLIEIRLTYRYVQAHSWVVVAINGFLSAYFMEQPSFRVRQHFDELESGMHVWLCEVLGTMKMERLLRRMKADIPAFQQTATPSSANTCAQYLIDCPDSTG